MIGIGQQIYFSTPRDSVSLRQMKFTTRMILNDVAGAKQKRYSLTPTALSLSKNLLTLISLQTYQWGFSYIQLNVMLIILFIWTWGVYFMWLKAHLTMRIRNRKGPSGDFKSIVELSEAIRAEMEKLGKDVNDLTNDELKELSREQLRGGKMGYVSSIMPEHYSFRKGLSRWARQQWPWIILTTIHLVMAGTAILYYTFAYWLFWIHVFFLTGIAMLIASTTRSRVFLTICSYLVSLIAYQIMVYFRYR